jgi:hypothetical protein
MSFKSKIYLSVCLLLIALITFFIVNRNTFHTLYSAEAAEADLAKGDTILIGRVLPCLGWQHCESISNKYGFTSTSRSCIVEEGDDEGIAKYNSVVEACLNKRNKPGWKEKYLKELDSACIIESDTNTGPAIFKYDYSQEMPVRNNGVNSDTLNVAKLLHLINTEKIHLYFVKASNDTIFFKIKESTYLTQSIGNYGADAFISTATWTLTELKGIKYVNFDFKKGRHGMPGTYSRQYYIDRYKRQYNN